jgi:uncharacterized OB-fold protein
VAIPKKPVPIPDVLSRPYWLAAKEDRLEIQRCQSCSHYHHPPVAVCPQCLSEDLCYEPVSGRGVIYTYSITHDARNPAFAALQPYAVVWVDLVEQARLRILTNMPDTPLEKIRVGAPVEVYFEALDDNIKIPQFRLASTS